MWCFISNKQMKKRHVCEKKVQSFSSVHTVRNHSDKCKKGTNTHHRQDRKKKVTQTKHTLSRQETHNPLYILNSIFLYNVFFNMTEFHF